MTLHPNLDGWETKDLRDLVTINYGRDPSAILAADGSFPVFGTSGRERLGTDYLYDGESIVLGRKGTIDRIHFVSGKFWAIDTAYFLSDFREVLPRWLYYFLTSVDFRKLNEATGVPSLSRELLYKIEILRPPSAEQEKIAVILETVDRAIEQTERLIAKQQHIRTGLMQDLLTRGIDEDGHPRTEQNHEFKVWPLGRIPNDWNYSEIHEALELVLDFRGRTPKKLGMEWGGGEIPALSAKNVEMGQINLDRETYYGSDALYQRWMAKGDVSKGDVVMTTEAPLGNVAQIPDNGRYILSQRVILMRGRQGLLLNNFLRHYLASEQFQVAMAIQSSGTTARGIQRRKFERLHIPLPDIREQERISSVLDSIDRAAQAGRTAVQKLIQQKRALLQDLLTGRRRVTALVCEPEMAME